MEVNRFTLIDRKGKIKITSDAPIRIYVRDPTDNRPVIREANRTMLFEWCKENCRGRFWIGMGFGQFEIEEDAAMFALRWK